IDAIKVDSISKLLQEANEMLADVKGHLHDYGERLEGSGPSSQIVQNKQLEIERLKQSVCEREEEARIARLERTQALEEVRTLREALTELELRLADSEAKQKQFLAKAVKRRSDS